MGVLGWAGTIIMGAFIYVGANALFDTVITGTSTGEVLVGDILPIILASCVIGAIIVKFR